MVAFVATYSLDMCAQKIQTSEVEVENRSNTKVTGALQLTGEFQIIGNDPKIRLLESNGGNDFAFNVANGRFRIQEIGSSTVERFTINNGKVGIGYTSPAYKFQVGNGRASIAPNADQNLFYRRNNYAGR